VGDLLVLKMPSNTKSMVGGFHYLTLTHTGKKVCEYLATPIDVHRKALIKRILRCIKGTISAGLKIHKSKSTLMCSLK
jgi:hypothetical protein